MNNQLLKHRIKWGTVIAICLAFSTIFPTKSLRNLFLETIHEKATEQNEDDSDCLLPDSLWVNPGREHIWGKIFLFYVKPLILSTKTIMQLQDIYVYPIKSLGGVRLSQAQAEIRGFSLDRRWMLVDKNGGFLSQRTHHQMALLQVLFAEDRLRVVHKQNPEWTHDIPLEPETNEFVSVKVWGDTMIGQLANPSSDKWFSKMLNFPCQLVYMPDSTKRYVNEKYAANNEIVSFADAMPYLLIGQKSLDNLNEKLEQPLPMNRFRPNLVFSGGEAFQEDDWDLIQIGDCQFKVTKPCARCIITTVDQSTAVAGKEPLRTLAKYRAVDKKVLFGQNLIALTTGTLKAGDSVRPI